MVVMAISSFLSLCPSAGPSQGFGGPNPQHHLGRLSVLTCARAVLEAELQMLDLLKLDQQCYVQLQQETLMCDRCLSAVAFFGVECQREGCKLVQCTKCFLDNSPPQLQGVGSPPHPQRCCSTTCHTETAKRGSLSLVCGLQQSCPLFVEASTSVAGIDYFNPKNPAHLNITSFIKMMDRELHIIKAAIEVTAGRMKAAYMDEVR